MKKRECLDALRLWRKIRMHATRGEMHFAFLAGKGLPIGMFRVECEPALEGFGAEIREEDVIRLKERIAKWRVPPHAFSYCTAPFYPLGGTWWRVDYFVTAGGAPEAILTIGGRESGRDLPTILAKIARDADEWANWLDVEVHNTGASNRQVENARRIGKKYGGRTPMDKDATRREAILQIRGAKPGKKREAAIHARKHWGLKAGVDALLKDARKPGLPGCRNN